MVGEQVNQEMLWAASSPVTATLLTRAGLRFPHVDSKQLHHLPQALGLLSLMSSSGSACDIYFISASSSSFL